MITVLPEITNNIISEDQLYCGSSVADTIMGTVPVGGYGSYTYNWMRSYVSATSGYVLLTTSTGLNYYPATVNQDMWIKRIANSGTCKDTANIIFIDIVTVPIPVVTLVGGNTLTTPDNGYSYQWYEGGVLIPGATDTFLVVTTTASYTVVATDTNGCTRTSANYNFVSVNEPSPENEFTFWPNPAHDKLNIQFNLQGNHQITLVNSLSQNVYKGTYNGSGTYTIPVVEMAKGVYFLKIDSGNGVKTHKVIIANK